MSLQCVLPIQEHAARSPRLQAETIIFMPAAAIIAVPNEVSGVFLRALKSKAELVFLVGQSQVRFSRRI